jgi:tetratricopeptide (TPR) repeat protein
LEGNGRFDEALHEHEQLIKAQKLPIDVDGYLDQAANDSQHFCFCCYQLQLHRLHWKRGDRVSAFRAIDRLLASQAPPMMLNNLAWRLATHANSGVRDPVYAIRVAERALKSAAQDERIWNTLGVAQYRVGKWNDAISALGKSMSLANGKSEAYNTFFLAMAHWQAGDHGLARQWYLRAVKWMEENTKENEELKRFRAEAEELMGISNEAKSSSSPTTNEKSVVEGP